MLRLLAFLLVSILAGPVWGQDAGPGPPTTGQRVLLVGGAVASGVIGFSVGPGAPVLVVVGTYATSAALGLRPTVGGVLLDSAVGTVVGVATWAALRYYVTEIAGQPSDLSVDLGTAATGLLVGAAATGASHGVRLALLRSPTGETAPGLGLRIRL